MKKKLLIGLAAFALISIGWHVFEGNWDRSLFPQETETLKAENIGVSELRKLLEEKPDLQFLDVRPRGSFESAHFAGAVHAPFKGGELKITDPDSLDPEKPVLVYCDGGYRSRTSIPAIKDAGFQEIYHLHRGILSWRLRGGECEKQ